MNHDPIDQDVSAVLAQLRALQMAPGGDATRRSLLVTALEDLSTALEDLGVTMEELRRQNDGLLAARQEIEAQRARYAALFELAPHGHLATDADGVIQEANRAAEAMLNMPQGFLVGKPLLVFVSKAQRRQFLTSLTRLLGEDVGAMPFSIELELQAHGCAVLPAEVSVAVVRAPMGDRPTLYWLIQDVSARKQAEAESARLAEQLLQARKLEAVGLLAGGTAHGLNNLLTPILGYASIVRSTLSADDQRAADLDQITRAGERARDLVRQMLAFARKQSLELRPLDLNDLIRTFENMLRPILSGRIRIETHLASSPQVIDGDSGQIGQVIVALAVNAQDAMPAGGALTFETAEVHRSRVGGVEYGEAGRGSYVMMTVRDTGAGMDATTLDRLFEPFMTTKDATCGAGLSLSAVYGIVKQHGGSIEVSSEPEVGTVVRIYFPRLEDQTLPVPPAQALAEPPHGTETILLVEDDERVCALAREILTRYGYTVLEAVDAEAALALSTAHKGQPIDLMVVDVVLPDMSGPMLRQRLAPSRPGLRVLYMSGYPELDITRYALKPADGTVIQKPFLPDELARVVRQVLEADR